MCTNYIKSYTAIFILFLISFLNFNQVNAQENYIRQKGTIYLVRHAEKETGNDPKLSTEGYQRSGDLEKLLKSKQHKLNRVYVNQFRRTQFTADSIRIKDKVDTVHYVADNNGDDLINVLLKNKSEDKRILVIGHSNTIPVIIKRLGIQNYPVVNIPENEFDNLYTITYRKGKAYLFNRKYGKRSPTVNDMPSMKLLQ